MNTSKTALENAFLLKLLEQGVFGSRVLGETWANFTALPSESQATCMFFMELRIEFFSVEK